MCYCRVILAIRPPVRISKIIPQFEESKPKAATGLVTASKGMGQNHRQTGTGSQNKRKGADGKARSSAPARFTSLLTDFGNPRFSLRTSHTGRMVTKLMLSRARAGPQEFLKNFRGKLQTDGYGAYESLAKARGGDLTLVGCWAHVRRGFHPAMWFRPRTGARLPARQNLP